VAERAGQQAVIDVRQWEAIEERRRALAVQTFSVAGARAE
jgi:hypothetical protein